MADDEDVAISVGLLFTTKLSVIVSEQPEALVPLSVYTVVASGLTVTADPVNAPGFQLYD